MKIGLRGVAASGKGADFLAYFRGRRYGNSKLDWKYGSILIQIAGFGFRDRGSTGTP
jgi:hypothetical protein